MNPRPAGGGGFVGVVDGHLQAGTERLRLFGVNVTGGACFPDKDAGAKIAARMARFGVNAVRFHFLDATWGEPRLIDYESGANDRFRPEVLDRLDAFVFELKERGIYTNLNLLVGKRFGVGDGVDPAIAGLDWKVAHAIGFFHEPHLRSQQAYARALLTHRNPYTGLTYAEDPAVALVEINNENGLLHQWFGGTLDALPEPFAGDLAARWNDRLRQQYGSTAALRTAWKAVDEPLGDEILVDAGFAEGTAKWNPEQHGTAEAEFKAGDGEVTVAVSRAGSEGWHVQLNQAALALEKGRVYTFRFRASADSPRKVSAGVMQAHDPWASLGFGTSVELAPEPREFSYTFIATDSDENARAGFSDLNVAGATFRFSDISLRPGGRLGLGEGESLEAGTIPVPRVAGTRPLTGEGRADWLRFLRDLERAHWVAMRDFLRGELGVRVPITGTVIGNSTPNLMADMDLVDTHAYWQHPRFLGRDWDMDNWVVENVSMAETPRSSTVLRLAFCRVAGKPHMLSEYNHPAPNQHAAEGPLFAAAYGALQDWDAIFMYTYSHGEADTTSTAIPGFFNIGQHPTIWSNMPIAAAMFRRGDVAAARGCVVVPFGDDAEMAHIVEQGRHWSVVDPVRFGIDLRVAALRRIELATGAAPGPGTPRGEIPRFGREMEGGRLQSDTGELVWVYGGETGGLVTVSSPRTKALFGRADDTAVDLGDGVIVDVGKTRLGWCTVALTVLEGDSLADFRRALVVATGDAENTGMKWKNAERNTVGRDWGTGPVLVEPVSAGIRVPGRRVTVYALDERGNRAGKVEVVGAERNAVTFDIGPPHAETLWYEIVRER